MRLLTASIRIAPAPPDPVPLIAKVITPEIAEACLRDAVR
jgi:hypothetical protein